jgi:hypothetical protein
MNAYFNARAVTAALIGAVTVATGTQALADIKDYKFEVVDKAMKVAPDAVITVKLVNTKTGKTVPDAVIFATRLDMAPDGMQDMATTIAPVPSTEPGLYRFKAKVSMAGGWRLSLGAKVQGEDGTVDQKLVIKADE